MLDASQCTCNFRSPYQPGRSSPGWCFWKRLETGDWTGGSTENDLLELVLVLDAIDYEVILPYTFNPKSQIPNEKRYKSKAKQAKVSM